MPLAVSPAYLDQPQLVILPRFEDLDDSSRASSTTTS
jgi:hypothetical protein